MPLDIDDCGTKAPDEFALFLAPPDTDGLSGTLVKASKYTILVGLADGKRALAYNTRTTSFAVLDAAEVQALHELERDGMARCEGALEVLGATGFLAPFHADETGLVRQEYWQQRSRTDTLTITIAPTLGCNVSCHYCFQGMVKPNGKMSTEVQDAIVDYVRSRIDGLSLLSICWYGGEPLMDQKAIARLSAALTSLCAENGVSYSASMVSNGYLLNVATARRLYDHGITFAQVTIDGTEEAHDINRPLTSGRGTYKRTLANIKAVLSETDFAITVRCNVGTENVSAMADLLDELYAEGFGDLNGFSLYYYPIEASTEACASAESVGIRKAEFAALQRSFERKALAYGFNAPATPARFEGLCVAAVDTGLVIGPEGQIHRCWETLHDENKQVGTIFDMAAVRDNPANKRWKAWDPFDNPVCGECRISPMCAGFCSYKFVYPESTSGESGSLPCPKWKFSIAEYIFEMAETQGFVTARDWNPEEATAQKMQGGARHTPESVMQAFDIVNLKSGETVP